MRSCPTGRWSRDFSSSDLRRSRVAPCRHHDQVGAGTEVFRSGHSPGLRIHLDEAIRSFEEAARLDPDAAMPYWGVALALGPNINAPIDRLRENRASHFIQKARARLQHVTLRERAYVEALAKRYGPNKKNTRRVRDESYAKAMREVSRQFPDDLDAATLFAEALMDLRPWDYWKADGRPQSGTEEIITTLEFVLRRGPDHPGACHYYVHAVEASLEPQRARWPAQNGWPISCPVPAIWCTCLRPRVYAAWSL